MRSLILASACALGLSACANLDIPGLAGVDPSSSVGQGLTDLVSKASSITDKGLDGLATGADFYCSNAPGIARDGLRSAVNAKMAAKGSKYQLGNFCVEAAAKPAS